jgi:hypothetical protein
MQFRYTITQSVLFILALAGLLWVLVACRPATYVPPDAPTSPAGEDGGGVSQVSGGSWFPVWMSER